MFRLTGKTSRIESIDFLRGIAVWLVLFRHHEFWPLANQFGWMGVDLFFVLSGFLVSGLLFSEFKRFGNVKSGLFLIRRGFKIYPHFYLFLGIGLLAEWGYRMVFHEPKMEISGVRLIGEILFIQNYLSRIWTQTWSLAVEEHFYIGLAVVFFLLQGYRNFIKPWFIISCLIFLFVFVLGERIALQAINPKKLGFYFTHLRIDSLAFGVLLAYFHAFFREATAKLVVQYQWVLFGLSVALLMLCNTENPKTDPFITSIGLTMTYLGFGGILLLAVYTPFFLKIKQVPVLKSVFDLLTWSGFCSYAIYLWHVFVERYMVEPLESAFQLTQFQTFLPFILVSLLVSYFTTEYFEHKILLLRDRLFPKRIV